MQELESVTLTLILCGECLCREQFQLSGSVIQPSKKNATAIVAYYIVLNLFNF